MIIFRPVSMLKTCICCCYSIAKLCPTLWTPWTAARLASLSFTISWSLLRFISIESEMLSNHLILCSFLLLLPSIFPSIRVFSNELALCIRWPKYWELQLQHQSFQWIFRVYFLQDWLVWSPCSTGDSQKSLLQHHNSKATILWHSAFFMVQLTSIHDYRKSHSFVYSDLCWQSDVSAF